MDYLAIPLKKRAPMRRSYSASISTREQSGPLFTRDKEFPFLSFYWENPSLRFEGNSRDICRKEGSRWVDHNGWYVDHDQFETTKGVVYRLPSGRGFIGGCSDPWNVAKDGSGPCIIEPDLYETALEAAKGADSFAERYAESCREDDAKQQAEIQIEDCHERISSLRNEIRCLSAGIRESTLQSVVCARLRSDIRKLRAEMHEAWARIRKLRENHWESVA